MEVPAVDFALVTGYLTATPDGAGGGFGCAAVASITTASNQVGPPAVRVRLLELLRPMPRSLW